MSCVSVCSDILQEAGTSSQTSYDLPLLLLSVLLLSLTTLQAPLASSLPLLHLPSLLLTALPTLSLHLLLCSLSSTSSLCSPSPSSFLALPLLLLFSSVLLRLLLQLRRNLLSTSPTLPFLSPKALFNQTKKSLSSLISPLSTPSLFLLTSSLLHSLSLLSSSFVEEEHQTVYFFYSSLLLLLLNHNMKEERVPEKVATSKISQPGSLLGLVACLGCHRLAASFHASGDKWRHLPALGDWLGGHPTARGAAVLLSCTPLLASLRGENRGAQGVKMLLVLIILLQKLTRVPVSVIQTGYLMLLLLLWVSSRSRLEKLLQTVTFLAFLLHSSTNLPVISLLLLQLHLLAPALASLPPSISPLAYLLLAR